MIDQEPTPSPDDSGDLTAPPTPPTQNLYIRLSKTSAGNYELKVFLDPQGTRPMDDAVPLPLLGTGRGALVHNFIPPAAGAPTLTAALVIIGQTVKDDTAANEHRRDTPFEIPFGNPMNWFYPAHYLENPAGQTDPDNTVSVIWSCEALRVVPARGDQNTGPYKYTIVALCEGGTKLAIKDPCVIIKPK